MLEKLKFWKPKHTPQELANLKLKNEIYLAHEVAIEINKIRDHLHNMGIDNNHFSYWLYERISKSEVEMYFYEKREDEAIKKANKFVLENINNLLPFQINEKREDFSLSTIEKTFIEKKLFTWDWFSFDGALLTEEKLFISWSDQEISHTLDSGVEHSFWNWESFWDREEWKNYIIYKIEPSNETITFRWYKKDDNSYEYFSIPRYVRITWWE